MSDNISDTRKNGGSFRLRIRALIVLAFVLGLLGVAVYLDPIRLENTSNTGYRFLSPCGFLQSTGYPCPTCYMTRSFTYLMHGRPDRAFLAQPFGALLCLMVIYLGWGAISVLYTGKSWKPFWFHWSKKWLIAIILLAFMSGWIFRLVYGTFITHEFPLRH
ncbi:MAG: DUF2752 domain-containing protein [Phycisphaerae bacterium]